MNETSNLTFSKNFRRRLTIALYVMIAIAIIGIIYHIVSYLILKYSTEQQTILAVATMHATKDAKNEEIVLPGTIQAWHDATIYARTNGYVVKWMVDIGATVKAGDLLAEITAPEINAELEQANANLKTAEANNALAQSTAVRWLYLLKSDSVSKQETDEKVSDAQAKAALVVSARANRDRLQDLVSFQRVVAPFDGVIMSRTTDIGRLINAGSGTVPLFRLTQSNRLRVYIRVPEYYSTRIKPNLMAKLYFTEHPGKIYSAKLLDTAKAIDHTTRTLLVQFEIDNSDNELLAGSYTQVHLILPASMTSVNLPVNTLIFRSKGPQVATIDGDNTVVLKSIVIGRDFGDDMEIVSGIQPGEAIVLNPPDSLTSGQKVKIVASDSATGDLKA